MTAKLTPPQLRDLASLERMMMRQGRERFEFLEHEAARREAEQLDPVGTASLAASLAQSKDKPAPAADDLVAFLRGRYQQHCTLAADRIEAETARAEKAEAENARLREALALILPLAKGYAHAHQINRECIATASAALARGGDR